MKLVRPSFEILEQKPKAIAIPDDMEIGPRMVREELLSSVYRQIEIAGRICYKSEDKITDTSAKSFVDRMVKSGHGTVLEHGTVYLNFTDNIVEARKRYIRNFYSKVYKNTLKEDWKYPHLYVVTNYRVLVENGWLEDLQYICKPTEYHEKRITVKFVCDRGVLQEFRTHRVFSKDDDDNYICDVGNFSACAESTRYCNYSKDKFGNECTFIYPNWFNKYFEDNYSNLNIRDWQTGLDIACAETNWIYAVLYAEKAYFSSISNGMKPQQARTVLPNSLKTELVMTGFVSDWKHFFRLRVERLAKSKPHPQASELATPLYEEFVARGYIDSLE
jgi:thymidylate synthase (FAD)|uniref:Thymidylate synthase complementing protein n=1 Tax=Podoviridae sp. ct8Lf7 TaxID=2827723 RepID=A0A8S5S0H7_9CAUD|nr:MAG TPA: Thymidylate synthase complementing protein [Podoviridae sp. ct8Lf7]